MQRHRTWAWGWEWGRDTSMGLGCGNGQHQERGDRAWGWEWGTGHGHRARDMGTGHRKPHPCPSSCPQAAAGTPAGVGALPASPQSPRWRHQALGTVNTSTTLPARWRPGGDSGEAPGTKAGCCLHPEHPAATLGTAAPRPLLAPLGVPRAGGHGGAQPLQPAPFGTHQGGVGGQDAEPDALSWLCGVAESCKPPGSYPNPTSSLVPAPRKSCWKGKCRPRGAGAVTVLSHSCPQGAPVGREAPGEIVPSPSPQPPSLGHAPAPGRVVWLGAGGYKVGREAVG